MRKKLLFTLFAVVAMSFTTISYAQIEITEALVGSYVGELNVSVDDDDPISKEDQNIIVTQGDQDENINLSIKDFVFPVQGKPVVIGDVNVNNIPLQREGNDYIFTLTDTEIYVPYFDDFLPSNINGKIDDNNILTLDLDIIQGESTIKVLFEGEKQASSIGNIQKHSFTVYPTATYDMLSIDGIEGGKYNIYNIAGSLVKTGMLTDTNLNVSDLGKGLYFLNIEKHTVKFIKR